MTEVYCRLRTRLWRIRNRILLLQHLSRATHRVAATARARPLSQPSGTLSTSSCISMMRRVTQLASIVAQPGAESVPILLRTFRDKLISAELVVVVVVQPEGGQEEEKEEEEEAGAEGGSAGRANGSPDR